MERQVFGIRHHGPGCARSLVSALTAFRPDIVLIEGPPEADELLSQASAEGMEPPVTLLIYPPDEPQAAVFYPFAEFSPEWQAILFALREGIAARFMDLPQSHLMALQREERSQAKALELPPTENKTADSAPVESPASASEKETRRTDESEPASASQSADQELFSLRDDPVGALALAAGFADRELWWEHQVELRRDPTGLFQGIMEAMVALRTEVDAQLPPPEPTPPVATRQREALREAYMRQQIRRAEKEDFQRIAVVCGAWHAPVLTIEGTAKQDAELLKGLPKIKLAATWAPWSYERLATRSGYGAGVTSPGWYQHLWKHPEGATIRWATRAARLMRQAGQDISSASVIEAVRLSEALAGLRALPLPSLVELTEALITLFCQGEPARYALIRDKLEIGARFGKVPESVAAVPLQRDLEAQQKRLRMPVSGEIKSLELDLRKENDRARSTLLHRLLMLKIPWGKRAEQQRQTGTFKELWQLKWQVEFTVDIIDASVWGNTVEAAAGNAAIRIVAEAVNIPALLTLLDQSILSELPIAVEKTLDRLEEVAAVGAEIRQLMEGLPPLARVIRYGDVRQTPTERLRPILHNLMERILIGLPLACASLDDEAATAMSRSLTDVQECLLLLDEPEYRAAWQAMLRKLMQQTGLHGLIAGRCCRLLLELRELQGEELDRHAHWALTPGGDPTYAGAWIEGLLQGSGLVLLQEDALWATLNAWLCGLTEEVFLELLPVLRRGVADFHPPERRAMGEKVSRLATGAPAQKTVAASLGPRELNAERVRQVLPVLAHVLGVPVPGSNL